MAVQAPPRSAVELKKLAMARIVEPIDAAAVVENACATSATAPAEQAVATMIGRTDANARPTVAQYTTIAPSTTPSVATAITSEVVSEGGRKTNATASRMAASPALNRKNLTPASRETMRSE